MPVDKFGRMSDNKTKDTGVSLTYINNNYVRSDGETPLTGSLNMRGNTIYNVADPVNPQDVVTKVYVDNTKGSGVIGRKIGDSVSIKENMDFLGKQKIKNLPDPVNDHDAVTKEYVDSKGNFLELDNPFKFKDNIYEAKDNINLKGFKISEVSLPSEDGDVATKEYIDTAAAAYLQEDQGKYTVKGDIDMGNTYTLFNVKPPIDKGDIVDKKYVDDNIPFKKFNNGFFATDEIIMRKKKLGGLREPTQDGEAATKKYVDDLQTQYVDAKGNIKFSRNINLDNKRIFALKEPRKDNEAANKKYVDDTVVERIEEEKANFLPKDPATKTYVDEAIKGLAGGDLLVSKEGVFIKANGHYRATAPLDIDNHKMENLPDPVDDKDAVNKKYIDGIVENLTLKQGLIRENGGFNLVDSYINMNFHNIRNVGLPKDEADAVPKRFVDEEILTVEEKIQKIKEKSEERPFLKENGNYQASTSINMNFNRLLNLHKPTEPYDAATKDYVDYIEKEVDEKIQNQFKEINQLVSVSASCYEHLKTDDYPFTFGGPILNGKLNDLDKYNGFLVPADGFLKHVSIFSTGLVLNIPPNTITASSLNEALKEINKIYAHNAKKIKLFSLIRISNFLFTDEIIGSVFVIIPTHINGGRGYPHVGNIKYDYMDKRFEFRPNPNYLNVDKNFIFPVRQGDIINIKSEYTETVISSGETFINEKGYYKAFPYNFMELGKDTVNKYYLHLATLTFLFKEMSFPDISYLDPL